MTSIRSYFALAAIMTPLQMNSDSTFEEVVKNITTDYGQFVLLDNAVRSLVDADRLRLESLFESMTGITPPNPEEPSTGETDNSTDSPGEGEQPTGTEGDYDTRYTELDTWDDILAWNGQNAIRSLLLNPS